MQRKLTITIDDAVYEGLYKVIGARKISRFIEDLVRPHVIDADLDAGYAAMAADDVHEAEAMEWIEALSGETLDESD
jgi:predicted CopG family antitoxin